jgi:hypothetical protein
MEIFLILIPVVILIALAFRFMAGGLDHDRIKQYVESRGGQVLDSNWAPFGPGWFGEKSDRIYGVRYLDNDGNEHEAHCKTSMWTGVYFTEDRIVRYAERPNQQAQARDVESLEEENERLRQELQRLKREEGGGTDDRFK